MKKIIITIMAILLITSVTTLAWNPNPTYNPFEVLWNAVNALIERVETRLDSIDAKVDLLIDEAGESCDSVPYLSLCGDLYVNQDNDRNHCGECNLACGSNEICEAGICFEVSVSCPSLTPTQCGDACVDTNTNRDHCGGCNSACPSGQICSNGACVYSCGGSTPTLCGDACVNTDTDNNHCGACGQSCSAGKNCQLGVCVVLPTCFDGLWNGDETDVDCGGSCEPCYEGQQCIVDSDCWSANCDSGICA